MTQKVGLILATHSGREKDDFIVVKRVTGTEYPPVDVEDVIRQYEKEMTFERKRAFPKVWFQPTEIPE